jgi:hypothetical protein
MFAGMFTHTITLPSWQLCLAREELIELLQLHPWRNVPGLAHLSPAHDATLLSVQYAALQILGLLYPRADDLLLELANIRHPHPELAQWIADFSEGRS